MKKTPIERVIEKKQRSYVVDGTVTMINQDGSVTVQYGGRTRNLLNMSTASLYINAPVTVVQLYGNPDMAYITGLSPRLSTTPRTVWL